MQTITTVGLDIAKSVFQVHGVDVEGKGSHPPTAELFCSREPLRGSGVYMRLS
jgi:hypothetical protein